MAYLGSRLAWRQMTGDQDSGRRCSAKATAACGATLGTTTSLPRYAIDVESRRHAERPGGTRPPARTRSETDP